MTILIPRAEITAVMERHHDGWRPPRDMSVDQVRSVAVKVRAIGEIGEADDLDALADRYEREVRRTGAPRSWAVIGIAGAVIGLALWIAVGVVAWHFLEKYW